MNSIEGSIHLSGYALTQLEQLKSEDFSPLPEAKNCNVIVYSHATLAEKDEQETDCDWEIITVLGNQLDVPACEPMIPQTLMYNHYELSGGTSTNMTPESFEEALKTSVLYWKDKAMIDGRRSYWLITDEKLVERTKTALKAGHWSEGYRKGVLEVHIEVNPGEFYSSVRVLQSGDKLFGEYKPRWGTEEPRKSVGVANG